MSPAFRVSIQFSDEPAPFFLIKKGELIGRGREHEANLFTSREEAEKASMANSLWQQAKVEIQEVDRAIQIRAQMEAHLVAAAALAEQINISLDWKLTERF